MVVVVLSGGGGVKCIYAYRHFSRYLHMYVDTIPYLKLAHSLCPSEQGGRKKREKENRKGGLSYSYFIHT